MTAAIFNSAKTIEEYKNTPIFMGPEPGFMDTIYKNHPKLWNLYKELKALDWSEDEFDFTRCLLDFKNCHQDTSDMMIETIGWQWEADSVAARSVIAILLPFISSTEYWTGLLRISDNECLTPDHEVYVRGRGWVSIANVNVGDIVIQYNADGTMQYTPVTHTFSKQYNDVIITFTNKKNNINQSVTKRHRMAVNKNGNTNFYEAKDVPTNVKFITTGKLIGSNSVLTPKDRFWIAFQADGSYSDKSYTGNTTGFKHVTFGFKKQRKKDAIVNLINQLGYTYKTYDRGNDYTIYKVYIPLNEFIEEGKTFGWVDLSNVDHTWCKLFIDEVAQWDGTIVKNNKKHVMRYSSSIKECTDIVSTIAAFSGYRTTQTTYSYNDGIRQNVYYVYVNNNPLLDGRRVNKTVSAYNGTVHCITVQSGAFLTRRDNVISVTGNCIHGATYSEIVKLSFEDTDSVMQRILNFKNTQARMTILENTLSEALTLSRKYAAGEIEASDELYRDVPIKTTICLLFLERVQFMASFAVTFSICSTGLFQPIGKAVQKICQDELEVHAEFDKEVLKYELKTERGQWAMESLKPWMHQIADEFIQCEYSFIDSLFRDGRHLPGVTPDMLKQWVLYNAKDVVRFLGLDMADKYTFPKYDPMPLLETWINMNKTQAAPQEQDLAQYKVGVVIDDAAETVFDLDF